MISNPENNYGGYFDMSKFNDRTGETRIMNNGLKAMIITYRDAKNIDVRFENGQILKNREYNGFKNGRIKCPMQIEYCGEYAIVNNPNLKNSFSFLIDVDDIPLIENKICCLGNHGYVMINSSKKKYLLHRLIVNARPNDFVDHRDMNKLNIRKQNLRVCTQAENNRNVEKRNYNRSGYKGVYKKRNRWGSRIGINNGTISLGYFDTPEEAAIAYNEAALKYHGEFARLNTIE